MFAHELRQKFLGFFKEKGHAAIPSSSLIPENDPTTLFITAGMHPLVPYLLGEKHPAGQRLADVQKCIRTTDIDEVGDATHHTFFEMLGNWSLGSYFKEEAIQMSWDFLTLPEWLGLDKNKLSISVFAGDANAPFDEEAYNAWLKLGIPAERIAKLPKEDNWWGLEKGPCGPDTEIFFNPSTNSGQVVEIWNNVFMEFNKTEEGKLEPLKQKNVDTGMGLERVLAILNNLDDNYRTELFWPIIEKIEELSGKKYDDYKKEMRIIADHLKAATFILAEGIAPSNVGRGYVARRLIRRAVRYGRQLGIKEGFCGEIAEIVRKIYKDVYLELYPSPQPSPFKKGEGVKGEEDYIVNELETEEKNFEFKVRQGIDKLINLMASKLLTISKSVENQPTSELNHKKEDILNALKDKKNIGKYPGKRMISGKEAFDLFTIHGFPLELTKEIASEYGFRVDEINFNEEFKKHQEISRAGAEQKFKGGLADQSGQTIKYHTATHLLLAALRQILGDHIYQKGSNITTERLRFDFSHPEKITQEQIEAVENLVNQKIQENLFVESEEMLLEEARKRNAMGVFGAKYGEIVKVYSIGPSPNSGQVPFSREICGGPHVKNTGELGTFKIVKEEAVSQGVRRIKAVLSDKVIKFGKVLLYNFITFNFITIMWYNIINESRWIF